MEFTGRIKQVLPMRSGTSQRTGNQWQSLPFIFEYFENPTDRYSDQVKLETMDTGIMEQIKENLPVRIGFGHRTQEYNGNIYNEIRMYKFEVVGAKQPVATAPGTGASAGQPAVETAGGVANNTAGQQALQATQQDGKEDDLPF